MIDIKSGNVQTGGIAPDGSQFKAAVDNQYVTKDEFLLHPYAKGLNITASSPEYTNGYLDKMLLSASAEINRICGNKHFDTQTIWETKQKFRAHPYNPQLTVMVMKNRPYQQLHKCYIQVLKWFIEVDVSSANSYVQQFPPLGYFKIVPLLSSSGTGAGSPIPAAILDKSALGVLWAKYTFGYGTSGTAQPLTANATYTSYQAPYSNRLWAPDQTTNIYVNGVLQTTGYSIDYPNGTVTFTSAKQSNDVITADFTTNESIPQDIKECAILLAAYTIGQGSSNPLGVSSYSIQTYSQSGGKREDNPIIETVKSKLEPYINKAPVLF